MSERMTFYDMVQHANNLEKIRQSAPSRIDAGASSEMWLACAQVCTRLDALIKLNQKILDELGTLTPVRT